MTLEFLAILVFFLIFSGFFIFLLLKLQEKIGQQSQINLQQARDIQEMKEKLLLGTDKLKDGIEKTRELVEELRRREEVRKEKEKELLERLKRVDEVLIGTFTRGLSGEEILRETFKIFPPGMIETNFKVRGKTVEFALILPNGKRLPIDSKWPASKLLLDLEKETDPEKKKQIIKEIEEEIIKRISQVKQYIDPDLTWSQAIAAVPDSVYFACQKVHWKATKENVLLVPYSMTASLLLYIFRLHLQYTSSIDIENLQSHLISISKNLSQMEEILENKIAKANTMIFNAYTEYKGAIEKIKNSLLEIQSHQKNQDFK